MQTVNRAGEVALPDERADETFVETAREFGTEFEHAAIGVDRAVEVAHLRERDAEKPVGEGVPGIEFDRTFQRTNCVVEIAARSPRHD